MRWRGRRGSSSGGGRRGARMSGGFGLPRGGMRMPSGGASRAGFGGIGFIIVIVVVSLLLGVNPMSLLEGMDGGMSPQSSGQSQSQPQGQAPAPPQNDAMAPFVSVVLAASEDTAGKGFRTE